MKCDLEKCEHCEREICPEHTTYHYEVKCCINGKVYSNFFCSGLCMSLYNLSEIIDKSIQLDSPLNKAWFPVIKQLQSELWKTVESKESESGGE